MSAAHYLNRKGEMYNEKDNVLTFIGFKRASVRLRRGRRLIIGRQQRSQYVVPCGESDDSGIQSNRVRISGAQHEWGSCFSGVNDNLD